MWMMNCKAGNSSRPSYYRLKIVFDQKLPHRQKLKTKKAKKSKEVHQQKFKIKPHKKPTHAPK